MPASSITLNYCKNNSSKGARLPVDGLPPHVAVPLRAAIIKTREQVRETLDNFATGVYDFNSCAIRSANGKVKTELVLGKTTVTYTVGGAWENSQDAPRGFKEEFQRILDLCAWAFVDI